MHGHESIKHGNLLKHLGSSHLVFNILVDRWMLPDIILYI